MSRLEKFDPVLEAEPAEDADERFLRLWVKAGYYAQNFTILALLGSACAILIYHL